MEIRYGVTHEDWQDIQAIGGNNEQALCRLIARSKRYWDVYRGFNQGNTERFWYSCVIVSWLRAWFSLYNPTESFTDLMYLLCDHMEAKWIWNPKAGWAVHEIGEEFVRYMNNRYPDKKVWKTKVAYGSSAMWGCLKRNIPIVTAYISSREYELAHSDWEISGEDTKTIKYGTAGHCITITGLWPFWLWLEFQDNYERAWLGNTYKTYFFRRVMEKTWFQGCFYALIPEDIAVAKIKDRVGIVNW